jgi:thiosulfate reductase cytochrome b subunit
MLRYDTDLKGRINAFQRHKYSVVINSLFTLLYLSGYGMKRYGVYHSEYKTLVPNINFF